MNPLKPEAKVVSMHKFTRKTGRQEGGPELAIPKTESRDRSEPQSSEPQYTGGKGIGIITHKDGAEVRAQPKADGFLIKKLEVGTRVDVVGQTADGWSVVQFTQAGKDAGGGYIQAFRVVTEEDENYGEYVKKAATIIKIEQGMTIWSILEKYYKTSSEEVRNNYDDDMTGLFGQVLDFFNYHVGNENAIKITRDGLFSVEVNLIPGELLWLPNAETLFSDGYQLYRQVFKLIPGMHKHPSRPAPVSKSPKME